MAAGDRIFMAKESTSQEILSNTKKIIEDAKAKPKRYGMRINLLDSNPATRVKYLYDAVGMTPAGMNFTVLFEKPLLSVGLNLLLVIPGVLVANAPLWIAYPYCYSGYLVSCFLYDFTAETFDAAFSVFPFLPCAIVVFGLFFALAVTQFGKKEMR